VDHLHERRRVTEIEKNEKQDERKKRRAKRQAGRREDEDRQ
jgi:hypothetical protein